MNPLAVIVAAAHVGSVVKSRIAVVPSSVTLNPESVAPPVVYPSPLATSLVLLYVVVVGPYVAELV